MASFSMTRRTVAIIVAIVLGIVAVVAIVQYTQGVKNEAQAQNEPVQVYVAQETIPAGMTAQQAIDQGLIVQDTAPRRNVPAGAIDALSDIEGRVAAAAINPGEEIVAGRFVQPGQATTALSIPEGFHAISIDVGLVPSAAGFIEPGSRVGVLLNANLPDQQAADGQAGEGPSHTEFLMQNVQVIAIGRETTTTTNQEGEQQQETSTVATLALRPQDAERLAHAQFVGQLYLTLMPDGSEIVDTPGADGFLDLFGGELDAGPPEEDQAGQGGDQQEGQA